MLVFNDVKEYLARYVDGGVCADDPRVRQTVDEAVERLINKPALAEKLLVRAIQMDLRGDYVTLPPEVGRILRARIDGYEGTGVYSRWYEFMDCGPGPESTEGLDLVDVGEVCTQYDIPIDTGVYLMINSTSEEDAGLSIHVRGIGPDGKEVFDASGRVGERLNIPELETTATKSYALYTRVANVIKPESSGYIYLSGIDPLTGDVYHLSAYRPKELSPRYRRYRINGLGYSSDDETVYTAVLQALVRMRPLPTADDSDPLLIDNRAALKAMCKAIYFYDNSDPKSGAAYEALAEKLLMEEARSYSMDSDDGLNIQMEGWATGEIPALI